MKGMWRFDPCNATLPEYSPAVVGVPERVTVKVEVAPAASVKLERAAVTVAPGSEPGLPFTVQQETFGVSVTELDAMLVTVTVFAFANALGCTMPNETVAGSAVRVPLVAAPASSKPAPIHSASTG